jgi:hypothetical protein
MAVLSPSLAFTMYTPTIDASTPMARAITGKISPSTHLSGSSGYRDWKAAKPRMIDATSVTS